MWASKCSRWANTHLPSARDSRSASAWSPSAMTITEEPACSMSAQVNPGATEAVRMPGWASSSWARPMIDLNGSSPVNCPATQSCGSWVQLIVGRISPRSVRTIRSAASRPRSARSVCGKLSHGMMTSAFAAICGVMLQCRSSVTKIGRSGPMTSLMASSRSPSPSSTPSATIAPCRSKSPPSTGMAACKRSMNSPFRRRQADASIGLDGCVAVHSNPTSSNPCSSALSRYPAGSRLVPRCASRISWPRTMPSGDPTANDS